MNTDERLARIERSMRRWRYLAIGAVGAVCAITLGGAGKENADGQAITVREVRFVDEDGRLCGGIQCKAGSCALIVGNPDDKGTVAFQSMKGKTAFSVSNSDGKLAVFAGSEGPMNGFTVSHSDGQTALEVIPAKRKVSVKTTDNEGRTIWSAPVAAEAK
jgi:hypothetical protein